LHILITEVFCWKTF